MQRWRTSLLALAVVALGAVFARGADGTKRTVARAADVAAAPELPEPVSPAPPPDVIWRAPLPSPPPGAGPDRDLRAAPPRSNRGDRLFASAYAFNASVFAGPAAKPDSIGLIRRGSLLPVGARVDGPGCDKGGWFPLLSGEGYVCTVRGHAVFDHGRRFGAPGELPDAQAILPYEYAKARRHALRYFSIPGPEEQAAIAAHTEGEPWPDPVERSLDGAHFVGVAGEEQRGETRWVRTVQGRFVRAEDVNRLSPVPRVGEELGASGKGLPLAFLRQDTELVRLDPTPTVVGHAERFARFEVRDERTYAGRRWVIGPEGLAVPADTVRVARVRDRPADVPDGARWVHTHTATQTLVAYEGDRPVYATLVSSGIEGYDTPAGLFRIDAKYVARTMRGPDPDVGEYEVGQVPWTMYYSGGYALHGAYWHDDFGKTRSHGCTNLAPADARWLYYWTEPGVPDGWLGSHDSNSGSWVYVTH